MGYPGIPLIKVLKGFSTTGEDRVSEHLAMYSIVLSKLEKSVHFPLAIKCCCFPLFLHVFPPLQKLGDKTECLCKAPLYLLIKTAWFWQQVSGQLPQSLTHLGQPIPQAGSVTKRSPYCPQTERSSTAENQHESGLGYKSFLKSL